MTASLLTARHSAHGAALAADGIPLHYGDRLREYRAALTTGVIMDRSHEGRLRLTGRDRLSIPHRISTNAVESLAAGSAAPTLFTSPIARILDRVTLAALDDHAVMLTEPGRAPAVSAYLTRNIFFNDDLRIADETASSRQFVLFGRAATTLFESLGAPLPPLHHAPLTLDGIACLLLHDKPLMGDPAQAVWRVIVPAPEADHAGAAVVWGALTEQGAQHGLIPAGSLTWFALRVRAGRPGVNAELSEEYIPLEVGLWDEVSFSKGCYTGQEIIARMESRGRMARTIVRVRLDGALPHAVPAPCVRDGRDIGRITSAVETPDGEKIGIAVLRMAHTAPTTTFSYPGGTGEVIARAGVQPASLSGEE
jgi:folate-binding protein YgfZ